MELKRIPFKFHPYQFEKMGHAVEKADSNGVKRRYLRGVSSGLKTDQHKERMTSNCIKSFMEQANSGDILLYPDVHGIKSSEDIGILEKSEITANGDWFTEYRLYDEQDEIGQSKLEKCNTIWKQMNGLPPYKKPKQKGFSVEGFIPPSGILSAVKDEMGKLSQRVINDVSLDGVLLVPRPAYEDSIATAVYKALGELIPERVERVTKEIKGILQKSIDEEELQDSYYKKKWDLQDALENQIEFIMKNSRDKNKVEKIDILFKEYTTLYKDLVIKSESVFLSDSKTSTVENPYDEIKVKKSSKIELYKSILKELQKLKNLRYKE